MLMILDHWLARFFGAKAGRRGGRIQMLAQRASYGNDGVMLRQIDAAAQWSQDEAFHARPYAPYLRGPAEFPRLDSPFAPAGASHAALGFCEPAGDFDRERREMAATQESQRILQQPVYERRPSHAAPCVPRASATEAFVSVALEDPQAPPFWRADQPNVRFTRTPQSSLTRRKAEEEALRLAEEEARRLAEDAARRRAEEEALRVEETRLAQSHAAGAPTPRVRFTRTPDKVFKAREAQKLGIAEPAAAPGQENLIREDLIREDLIEKAPIPNPASPAATPLTFYGVMGARFSFGVGAPAAAHMETPLAAPEPEPEPEPRPLPAAAPSAAFALPVYASRVFATPLSTPLPARGAPPVEVAAVEPPARDTSEKIRVRVKAGASPTAPAPAVTPAPAPRTKTSRSRTIVGAFEAPAVDMLSEPPPVQNEVEPDEQLEINADVLEKTLEDFGVKGDILNAHPGPVVTLYEFEPAPGIKSSRVIGLADDIARSMSAVSARVAVVQGRNAIGIELPNPRRETVYLRELVASPDFSDSKHKLAIALGKTIGGEPVIVDLAKMPHLLVAGTTGSGKSVAINTMILSLLYRLKPAECRLIMVDPKMLELSVYDGIPHLLTPVVTDPKKAVVALKWAVREMEDRYKKMSKVGVRNIDGFNARVTEAKAKGEIITRTVQTGFDRESGEAIYEQEQMDLTVLPYIVVIVDEMADLMMVAGKDIEGAIQRLAQMARAAGIHLIMATQRPSVDVITGTIKANFPTRISFQVTSKIDSRTILGEMGAEQLLGQGDMLYMAGGGRISRVHGPFVSDAEVERVVAYLKTQGQPEYLDSVTVEDEEGDEDGDAGANAAADGDESSDLYDRAVAIVLRDKKCSTSYIQRRLSVGYNKAASLVERMEKEGVVGAANHAGKRQILVGGGVDRGAFDMDE